MLETQKTSGDKSKEKHRIPNEYGTFMSSDFNLDIFDISEVTSQFLKDATRRSIVADRCRKSKCLFSALFPFFGQVFFIPIWLIFRTFDQLG